MVHFVGFSDDSSMHFFVRITPFLPSLGFISNHAEKVILYIIIGFERNT